MFDAYPDRCVICGRGAQEVRPPLVVCHGCGHGFRPFVGDGVEYHASEFRVNHRRDPTEIDESGKPTSVFHEARRGIVEERLSKIRGSLQRGDRCLDVGAGAGTFARAISHFVESVHCTELAPELAAECRRLGFRCDEVDFLSQQFEQRFDVVFAWHVLEHVADAADFVSKALALAKRALILEVPTRRRAPTQFDGHFHYFTETSLEFLFPGVASLRLSEGVQKPAILAVIEP
ncbi:MAG: methyltransferase domain-containing protein [Myxococcota bacterium]